MKEENFSPPIRTVVPETKSQCATNELLALFQCKRLLEEKSVIELGES